MSYFIYIYSDFPDFSVTYFYTTLCFVFRSPLSTSGSLCLCICVGVSTSIRMRGMDRN